MIDPCNCPQCRRGLWCADGTRGEFVRGENDCKRCGKLAADHSTTCRGRR